jgi:hypothetical protein
MITEKQAEDLIQRVQCLLEEWETLAVVVVGFDGEDGDLELCFTHNAGCGHQLTRVANLLTLTPLKSAANTEMTSFTDSCQAAGQSRPE